MEDVHSIDSFSSVDQPKVCLCFFPPLEPAPAPWAVRSQALSLVSGSTSALNAGIQSDLSLTTCASVLVGIARDCRQKPTQLCK